MKQNRLHESLTLFESIVNSQWFSQTALLLFLNKTDVFQEKLITSPLEKYFPDFKGFGRIVILCFFLIRFCNEGGQDYSAASDYILRLFLRRNRSHERIYSHFTCATDTDQIKHLMSAMNDIVLRCNLKQQGLM
jgi:guanine nucleotide-binding protein subunit alpha